MTFNARHLPYQPHIWLRKALYSLLIFWVCGVGPLIYFESFSSHQGIRGYQPAILGRSTRSTRLPPELVQALGQHRSETPTGWFQPALKLYHAATSGTAHFLSFTFRDGYGLLLAETISPDGFFPLIALVPMASYGGCSAWLLPPEKPPPFCQRTVNFGSL